MASSETAVPRVQVQAHAALRVSACVRVFVRPLLSDCAGSALLLTGFLWLRPAEGCSLATNSRQHIQVFRQMAVEVILASDFSTGKQEKAELLGSMLVCLTSHFEILDKC